MVAYRLLVFGYAVLTSIVFTEASTAHNLARKRIRDKISLENFNKDRYIDDGT